MREIELQGVTTDEIDQQWDDLEPHISAGLEYANGELESDDIYRQIKNNQVVPVVVMEKGKILAVVTLEVVKKPKKKILAIVTAGGRDMDLWLDAILDTAEILAEEQGCEAIYVAGRPGWKRLLEPKGYDLSYTVLTRTLH